MSELINRGNEDDSAANNEQNQPESEDLANMDEIEKALGEQFEGLHSDSPDSAMEFVGSTSNSGKYPSNTSYLPSGAVPSRNGVLNQHAAEFWFPESRNCPCCNGFKHGCTCRASGVDTCFNPNCTDIEFQAQVNTDLQSRPAASTGLAISTPIGVPNNGNTMGSPQSPFCKFEASPGGCRFGASCRYRHRNTPTAGASGGFSPHGQDQKSIQCVFFLRGSCQYGDSCRFGHF